MGAKTTQIRTKSDITPDMTDVQTIDTWLEAFVLPPGMPKTRVV